MRPLLVIALLALTGCPTTHPDTQGTGTATPPSDNFAKVGDQIDKADQRVAAAVTVARENADKPEVVKAETGVALAYLPKPDPQTVDYVRARVGRANPEEYKRAEEAGRKLLAVIDANWAKAEQDAAKNKKALDTANCEITRLKAEVAQAKKDIVTYACAGIGGLLAIGAVVLMWLRQIVGAIACAIGAGSLLSFPALVDTPLVPALSGWRRRSFGHRCDNLPSPFQETRSGSHADASIAYRPQ
jgi:hypothetical protein